MNIHVPIFPANRIFRYVANVHLIAITFSYKSRKIKKQTEIYKINPNNSLYNIKIISKVVVNGILLSVIYQIENKGSQYLRKQGSSVINF